MSSNPVLSNEYDDNNPLLICELCDNDSITNNDGVYWCIVCQKEVKVKEIWEDNWEDNEE